MTEQKKQLQRRLVIGLVLFLYVALNGALILRHENWRDEAQAWQIAKYLNLNGLFAQLKYEGHPCLWYLLLMPLAKAGMPFGVMNWLSLLFMTLAAWLVLWKAPFGLPVKILLLGSGFFTYYYPVISRSYALVPFFLALLAAFYPERKEKPLWYGAALALLTQTHIYMLGLSFALSLFWTLETLRDLWEERGDMERTGASPFRRLAGTGLNLASALFLLWELKGSTDLNTGVNIHISSTLSSNLHRMSVAGQWAAGFAVGQGISDESWRILVPIMAFCFLIFLLWSWREALMLAIGAGSQLLMFTYVYLPSEQKAILLVHELIFLVWLALERQRQAEEKAGSLRKRLERLAEPGWQVLLVLLALLSIDGSLGAIAEDWQKPYSAGKDAAAYLREQVNPKEILVTAGDVHAYSVAAYAPEYEIWYPLLQSEITFSVWDENRQENISYEEMLERIRGQYPEAREVLLLAGGQNHVDGLEEQLAGLTPEFLEDAKIAEESVRIYRIEL